MLLSVSLRFLIFYNIKILYIFRVVVKNKLLSNLKCYFLTLRSEYIDIFFTFKYFSEGSTAAPVGATSIPSKYFTQNFYITTVTQNISIVTKSLNPSKQNY